MFEISFSELLVIAVVALVVIGPEKLPKVARTLGLLLGRVQRFASQVKDEVNREGRFEELQRLQGEVQQSILSVEKSVSDLASTTHIDSAPNQSDDGATVLDSRVRSGINSSVDSNRVSPKPRAKRSGTQALDTKDKKQPVSKKRIAKKSTTNNDEAI